MRMLTFESINCRETFRKEFKAANPDVKGVTAVKSAAQCLP